MKKLLFVGSTMIVGLLVFSFSTKVWALDAELTPDTYWQQANSLQVSAYQVSPDGRLGLVELYNNSDSLVDVTQWDFRGDFRVQSYDSYNKIIEDINLSKTLVIEPFSDGKIMPHSHVVVSGLTEVDGASYVGSGWDGFDFPANARKTVITLNLSVIPKDTSMRTDSYKLNTDGLFYRRTKNLTGYGASFSSSDIQIYDDGLYIIPRAPALEVVEIYLSDHTCAPENRTVICGDFIKFRMGGDVVNLDEYVVRSDSGGESRTKSNTFSLANAEESGEYLTLRFQDDGGLIDMTNSGGYVWLEDLYEGIRYGESVRYESFTSDKSGWSYIKNDNKWVWTTTPKPGEANLLTKYVEEGPVCPSGKYLNPDTGRCRAIEEVVNELAACPEGQERNPVTNRCRKVLTAVAGATLEPCKEGQERNPLTNRCRSIASAVAELIPCDEGYERNPSTNRCRKVVTTAVAGVGGSTAENNQSIVKNTGGQWSIWTWSLVAVGATGAIGYGVYEWRDEFSKVARKFVGIFGNK